MPIEVRSFRGPRKKVQIKCLEPSLAVQASKEETDINNIVARYLRTGELPQVKQALYADVSRVTDLATHLNESMAALEAFEALPADIRRFFDNDPVKLVAFASDGKNKDKAIELGLVERPVVNPPSQPSPGKPSGAGQATPPAGVPGESSGQVSKPS